MVLYTTWFTKPSEYFKHRQPPYLLSYIDVHHPPTTTAHRTHLPPPPPRPAPSGAQRSPAGIRKRGEVGQRNNSWGVAPVVVGVYHTIVCSMQKPPEKIVLEARDGHSPLHHILYFRAQLYKISSSPWLYERVDEMRGGGPAIPPTPAN